jgi:hypothetical protein
MLLDALDAQCPRDLPKAERIEGGPSVGMSDFLLRAFIPEGIPACPGSNESAITATLDSQVQDAVKDKYVDSVLFPFDYIPRPADGIHWIATQPKRSWYRTVVFWEKPKPGIAFCILETHLRARARMAEARNQYNSLIPAKIAASTNKAGTKRTRIIPSIIGEDDPIRVGHREVETILSSGRSAIRASGPLRAEAGTTVAAPVPGPFLL